MGDDVDQTTPDPVLRQRRGGDGVPASTNDALDATVQDPALRRRIDQVHARPQGGMDGIDATTPDVGLQRRLLDGLGGTGPSMANPAPVPASPDSLDATIPDPGLRSRQVIRPNPVDATEIDGALQARRATDPPTAGGSEDSATGGTFAPTPAAPGTGSLRRSQGSGTETGRSGESTGGTGTYRGSAVRTKTNQHLPPDVRPLDTSLQASRPSVLAHLRDRGGDVGAITQRLTNDEDGDGRFAVEAPLASGGMGAVLKVSDADLQRRVAIKVAHPGLERQPEAMARFLAEAQLTAQLGHPNIVSVHDIGTTSEGSLYYAMPLLKNVSLGRTIKARKEGDAGMIATWTESMAIRTTMKVLDAMGFAHERGVIHRDLKPDNIMLGDHGEVLVVDWGLAKVMPGSEIRTVRTGTGTILGHEPLDPAMTTAGAAMGTPHFMSPEQAAGALEQVDARSDVYSIGATLYELLSLKRAVGGRNRDEIRENVLAGRTIPLRDVLPGVHTDLEAITMRALAMDPGDRYPTCQAFAVDLQAYLDGRAVAARRRSWIERAAAWVSRHRRPIGLAAAGVALAAGGAVVAGQVSEHARGEQIRALVEQGRAAEASHDWARARDAYAGVLSLAADHVEAQAGRERAAVSLAEEGERARQDAARVANQAKAASLVAEARALTAQDEATDARLLTLLTTAYELHPLPETDRLRLDVLRRVEDRAVAVKRRRAEARMAEARGLLTGVGADLVSPESVRAIRQAGEALAAAAAEGVDVPGLAALSASGAAVAERSRAAVADAAAQAERVAQQAADQQVATDQITRARTMLAAGDLDAAASAVAQAQDRWAAVPGLLIVQAQVATAMEQRRVERARDARRQQAVATADASMESARAAKVRLRAAEDARGRAEVRRDEGRSSLALEQEIWAASRDADAARAEVEGALAAAWQAIRDEDIPLRLQIKGAWSSWLADGLRAASAERNTVLMASLSSRLADVDPDSYLRLRQGRGGLAAKMPGAWTVRPLAARWGDASTSAAMAWDGMGLDLPQGRYEVSCDGSTGIVFVAAGATQSVAAPTTPPPAMTGFSWRWIPTAEVWMSETEVTHAAYAAYVQDPEVWRNVTASWKRIRTGKAEVDEPLAALPRRQSRDEETWQVYVDGESGELLTKVEVPAALRPRPVTGVSRIDAVGFCRWLEGKIQRRVLLPSRSQWLAAATGGDPERAYPWGPIFDPDAVGGLGGTACRAVGTSPGDIGPFGHRDLGGNVREWIMARGRVLNATIAGGGFADTDRERFRATAFEDIDERTPHAMIGFRLVIP